MITTRTRILSFLATVAMLVSMFACFVIPASAAEDPDFYRTGWQKLIIDIREYADFNKTAANNKAPQVFADVVNAWLAINSKTDTVEQWEAFAGDGETSGAIYALKTALADGTIHWINFGTEEKDNQGKGNSDYPLYQHHEFYEAVGYADYEADKTQWSITAPADWLAIEDAAAATANKKPYLANTVFHLTGDIDFKNQQMAPLGLGKTSYFAGTIDGHNYGFSNVNVVADNTAGSVGLFTLFGEGEFRNFGVNSGSITINAADTASSVSTFGAGWPLVGSTTFNRVWSGATLIAAGDAHVNALAGTYNHFPQDLVVNGFTFYGETICKNSVKYGIVYGIHGGNRAAASDTSTFKNIVTYPKLPAGVDNAILGFSGESAYTAAKSDGRFSNVYGIGFTNAYRTVGGGATGSKAGSTFDLTAEGGRTFLTTADEMFVGTPGAAAYDLNKKQTAGDDAVYFTLVDGNVRPTGTVENRIVKATVNGTQAIYLNLNTEYTFAEFADICGIEANTINAITVGDVVATDTITVTADEMAITVSINMNQKLANALNRYKLDEKYLTAAAVTALNEFRAAATEAGEDVEKIQAVLDGEAAMAAKLETYSDYDNAKKDGKEIPVYSEYATYGAYNKTNNWVIKTAEDWKAMRDVADKATGDYFAGYTFHLVDDVDFNNVQMSPLGSGSAAGAGFAGTLNGHGFGFENIYVYNATAYDGSGIVTGLFLRLGDCIIQDFGVNSGYIRQGSANNSGSLSAFGSVPDGKAPTINRVWFSGMLISTCNAQVAGIVGTINNNTAGNVKINGAVMDGVYVSKGSGSYQYGSAILGGRGKPAGGKSYYNIIVSGELGIYSAWGDVANPFEVTFATIEANQSTLFRFSDEAAFAASTIKNVYGITGTNKVMSGYTIGDAAGTVGASSANLLTNKSDVEVAWTINNAPTNGDGETPVYFTLKGDKIRPVATADEMIVKYDVTIDGTQKIEYKNAGAAVDLAELFDFYTGEGATITINGEAANAEACAAYNVTDDLTIVVTYTDAARVAAAAAKLDAALAEYSELEDQYLKDGEEVAEGKIGLPSFRAQVATAKANSDLAALAGLRDQLANLQVEVTEDYTKVPAYSLHKTYEEYNLGKNWLIKTPADWKAMMAAVDGVAFENNVYFAGYTFHLTDDVDFAGENWLTPMGVGTDNKTAAYTPQYFGGTINGHGFGFENFRVYAHTQTNAAACDADYLKPGYQSGSSYTLTEQTTAMFYRLGNCRIENFGVNSGWIVGYAGNQQGHASTFGGLMDGYAPTLTNVWSYANLRGSGNQYVSALVGVADGGSYSSAAVINGAYFGGTMACSWTNGARAAYAILGERDAAVGANMKLTNIITNPDVYQIKQYTLDASVDVADNFVDTVVDRGTYHKFVMFSTADTAIPAGYANIYGISGTNKLDGAYVTGGAQSTVLDREGNSLLKTDVKEAAWTINNNQLDGVDAVYFTLVGDQIRPVSTADKAIVKVTSKVGDEAAEESFYNNGDVLSLTEDFGIAVVAGAEITVNGVAHTVDAITLAGDTEIVVTYNLTADATAALLPYEGLESKYFSNGAELDAMRALLVKEGVTNDELQTIIDWAATNVPVVWGADNYTKLPAYTEYAKYAAYNTANNWAIKEVADWLAMVEASKVENGGQTFEGYTFHVLNDIDFDGQRMDPLNFDGTVASTAMTNPFKGTIDGHGNALVDIFIKFANSGEDVTLTASGDTFAGIIGSMAGGAVIRDFGVDSGSISTSVGYMDLGTFGHVKNGEIATLQNVWSGVALSTTKTNGAIGGILAYPYKGKVTVNGAYFFGSATGTSEVSAIGGGNVRDCVGFFNTIGAPTTAVSNSMHWTSKTGLSFANNFAVGYDTVYSWNSGQEIEGIDNTDVKAASPEEAGYRVNIAQNDEQTFAKVYYTITEKGVRPTSDATNAIVKVTVDVAGTPVELYVNANQNYTIADLAAALNVDASKITNVELGANAVSVNETTVKFTDDASLTVTLYVCDHSANTNDPVCDTGSNYHHTICSECGEAFNRTKCSGTKVPTFDPETKEATHYVICTVCSNKIVANCDKGSLYVNPDDCTANHKWVFTDCSVHTGDYAEYVLEGTGNATHTFEGAWTAEGDQEYRQCVNCTTKEYREACKHTDKIYEWVEETKTHKITCANQECGADLGTVDCGGAWVAGDVNVETGASEHTKTCPDCKKVYTEACQGKKETNLDDCTAAGKWTFPDCDLHEDVAIAPEYTEHDFSASEWEPAEGVAGTKQAKTCAHCSAKLYRYIGGVEAAGVELMADAAGNIVLTLPVALKSAKLTFTVPVGYTITAVEGATEGAGFYTVSNIEAGAPITITVDSVLTAVGGTFGVEVTEAIAADGAEVTNAVAQATIGFTAKNGDANGDEAVNLSDALAVLYKVVGQEGAADINVVNANVVAPTTTSVDVNDVYEIVRIWLRETVFTL